MKRGRRVGVDAADDLLDRRGTLLEHGEDRQAAGLSMGEIVLDDLVTAVQCLVMAGVDPRYVTLAHAAQTLEVSTHVSIRRSDHGGPLAQDVVAGEKARGPLQVEAQVVGSMSRRVKGDKPRGTDL